MITPFFQYTTRRIPTLLRSGGMTHASAKPGGSVKLWPRAYRQAASLVICVVPQPFNPQSDNRTLKHDRNLRMRLCLVLNTQASLELVEAPLLSPLQLIPKTLLKVPKSEIPELSRTVNIETCQPFSP